jgi:hypothetical protein
MSGAAPAPSQGLGWAGLADAYMSPLLSRLTRRHRHDDTVTAKQHFVWCVTVSLKPFMEISENGIRARFRSLQEESEKP